MLAAAGGPDVPLGDLLAGDHTWRPAIEAICGWITGGRLDQVSAVDLGRAEDPRGQWRLHGGYGALLRKLAESLQGRCVTPVTRIHRPGRNLILPKQIGKTA